MIAQPLYVEDDAPQIRSRAARYAAERRRARTKRMRYAMTARIAAIVAVLTVFVVAYLALMGNVERMNYELGRVERERLSLVETSSQLDDALARLRSRERLSHVAAGLGMHEAQTFVAISLPAERPPVDRPSGLAFLAKLR